MKSSDDNYNDIKKDKKLESFLKENRPLHPRHSERDAEKIWLKIAQEKASSLPPPRPPESPAAHAPSWTPVKSFAIAFSTVAAVAVISFVSQNVQSPVQQLQPVATSAMSESEASLVEDSLELTFLDSEEMYEVTDLLSLGK